MKSFLILLVLVCTLTGAKAQNSDGVSADRYCELICTMSTWKSALRGEVSINLVSGQADSLFTWKDANVLEKLRKVTLLHTRVDALNYMSSIGWGLVSYNVSGEVYFLLFRRKG